MTVRAGEEEGATIVAKRSTSEAARDNRANQLNPTHPAYYRSRGVPADKAKSLAAHAKSALDNRANQLNPNNAAYEHSRGMSTRSGSSSNAGAGSAVEQASTRSFDASHYHERPALARELLHWTPRTGIHEGLAHLIEDFQANRGAQERKEAAT